MTIWGYVFKKTHHDTSSYNVPKLSKNMSEKIHHPPVSIGILYFQTRTSVGGLNLTKLLAYVHINPVVQN